MKKSTTFFVANMSNLDLLEHNKTSGFAPPKSSAKIKKADCLCGCIGGNKKPGFWPGSGAGGNIRFLKLET